MFEGQKTTETHEHNREVLDREARQKLDACDWIDMGKRLTLHAYGKLGKAIVSGNLASNDLRHSHAEEFAQDAIYSVIVGDRRWNPETHPDLTHFLKDVVDSKISHFLTSLRNQRERQLSDDGPEPTGIPNPDESLVIEDIVAKLQGDTELIELFAAMVEGYVTGGEIAQHLGISAAEVVNRRKRLRRRVAEMGYVSSEEMVG